MHKLASPTYRATTLSWCFFSEPDNIGHYMWPDYVSVLSYCSLWLLCMRIKQICFNKAISFLNSSRVRHVLADFQSDLPHFKWFEGIHHILNVSVLRDFMVGISNTCMF